MAIVIKGDNRGIAVEGDLTIEHLDFQFGQGVRSASGIRRNIDEAEVVEEIPVVDGRSKEYPAITKVQTDFFETVFIVKGDVSGQKRNVFDMPVEGIMHFVHDITKEWNPSDKCSVHKWKVLYQFMKRQKYFPIVEKERYADFVRAVVRYCFPETPERYSNNISKSELDDSYSDWSIEDRKLYQSLKKHLSPINLLPQNTVLLP